MTNNQNSVVIRKDKSFTKNETIGKMMYAQVKALCILENINCDVIVDKSIVNNDTYNVSILADISHSLPDSLTDKIEYLGYCNNTTIEAGNETVFFMSISKFRKLYLPILKRKVIDI